MARRLWAAPLTAALILALSANGSRAQPPEPLPPPAPVPAAPLGFVPPPPPGHGILNSFAPPNSYLPYPGGEFFVPPPLLPRPPQPLHDCLRRLNVGCSATQNSVGCGSLKAECIFVFGSCRAFYREPCLAPPPHGYGLSKTACPSCE